MSGIIGQRGIGQRSGVIGPAAQNQPAFLAQSTGQASIASGTTILWDTPIIDRGSNFASNTFTAPVSGVYQINYDLYLQPAYADNTVLSFQLKSDNRIYYMNTTDMTAYDSTNDYLGLNASTLVDMDANDTVFVAIAVVSGTNPSVSDASYFSGYLVA